LTTPLYRFFDFWHSGTRCFHRNRVVFGISGSFRHVAKSFGNIAKPVGNIAKAVGKVAKSFGNVAKSLFPTAKPSLHIGKWLHQMSLTMLIQSLANQGRAALPRHLDIGAAQQRGPAGMEFCQPTG
jgi:hypothetical protein